MSLGVVVVAAGSGSRLGRSDPKAFVELVGASILERSLCGVFDCGEPAEVVVVAPAELVDRARELALGVAGSAAVHLRVVAGGAERHDSVRIGLEALSSEVDTVLVHDAARALASGALFDRVAARVRAGSCGVIPALPIADTVKRVDGELVLDTVDRAALVVAQTPQGFPLAALLEAHRAIGAATDDAAAFEAAGGRVVTIVGEPDAFKITTPWDLARAERIVAGRVAAPAAVSVAQPIAVPRTGIGVDVHAFDQTVPLRLAGLDWPGEPGLAGHSDGDVAIHALCNALLSAAGLGDLGSRFGTADPRFAGASSEVFLEGTLALLAEAGLRAVGAAIQLVGSRPRIAPRRAEAEARLGALLGAPVSLGAATTDGLGFTGRAEGLVGIATASLLPR